MEMKVPSKLGILTQIGLKIFFFIFTGTINVTYQEFVHHLKNPSSTVIDVRNPKELVDTGMFPGSINIPRNMPKIPLYLL